MKKRILSMFLAIVMVVGMLSAVPVYAAEDCDHVDGDDTDHWCDVCYDPMEELCTDADGNHFCDVCTGHAYRFCTEAADGTWDGGTWDKINHLVICSVCHWSHWESHTDETSDGHCDVCGAYTGCTHANDSLTISYVEAGHQAWCSECEEVVRQDLHNLSYISDNGGHLPDCLDINCDYSFDKVSHVHDSKNWTGRNHAGHYVECDVCKYEVWQDHTETGACDICCLDVTEAYDIYVGGTGLLNGQYLDNDGNITTARPDGGYAYYKDGVLELNNYVYEGYGSLWLEEPSEYRYYATVASFVPLKLELTGTNALTTVVDVIDAPGIDGIRPPLSYLANGASGIAAARGGLTIGGSGSLEISTPDMGIAADSDLTIEGGTIAITSEDGDSIDMRNSSLTMSDGILTMTSKDGDGIDLWDSSLTMKDGILTITAKDGVGIDLWDSSLELLCGTVHITSEDYGIRGYEGGSVDISGGYVNIQANSTAIEAMSITVAENMMPEGCEINEVDYDTFGIVDREGIPLTGVILAEPQITGVTVTVDGVLYTDGRVVITPETESVVFTVSGTNFSKHNEKHLIVYANGVTISTTDTQFVIDEAAGTATWTVPVDLMDEFIGLFGFEIAYSDDGNVQEALVGAGIFLTYCAEHTPDNRGQTCQGYFCTACESWYGEKNDNHDWSNENGICARGCGTECAHESYTEGVCDVCGYDITAPVISGVENGKTYYTTQKVTVTDKNLDTVTLNGNAVTGAITLDGNKDVTYIIVATDKAGNSTTVTVTMKPIRELAKATENLTNGNVTSDDADALNELVAKLDELIADPDTSDDGESETLEQHKVIAESLLKTIEDTEAEIARITEEMNKHNGATVNSGDVAALEQLAKDIKELLDGDNLTDAEKTALTEDAGKVADMQKTITDTTTENKRISDAVDGYDLATVTSDDKADLEKLLADTKKQLESTNLTEEEISELNGDKKALEDLLTKIKGTDELIDKLTEDTSEYSDDSVKSTDKDAIEQIIKDIDALLETENLTEGEKKTLEDAKDKAEGLLETIDEAAKATESENTEKVENVTPENVTPENKTDLENAKTDLEKALEDNGGNYTEAEKKAIEDEIKRIDDALKVVENVEGAESKINALPNNITKDDTDDVDAAKKAYDKLSDYEKTLVDPEAKKKLDEAIKAAEEANKPADTNSPQTGDNSNMTLWFTLMFGSLAALFAILFGTKKKKVEDK